MIKSNDPKLNVALEQIHNFIIQKLKADGLIENEEEIWENNKEEND